MDLRYPAYAGVEPDLTSSTRIVRHDENDRAASGLYHRYRRLFIGDSVATGILEFERDRRTESGRAEARFRARREQWEKRGGYVETVTLRDFSSWIASPSCIVAEATDPEIAAAGDFLPLAQAVLRLPDDDWVVPNLAEPLDEIHDRELADAIRRDGPRASALIDYLGVVPEWADNKLAGSARHAGLREVVRLNGMRPARHQVRWALGVAFAIQALSVPGRPAIRLSDLGHSEIVNRASMRAIGSSTRCPARIVGKWRSAPPVSVGVDGRSHLLDVHWYCYARDVRDVL